MLKWWRKGGAGAPKAPILSTPLVMVEAPTTGGEVLTPNDAVKVLEELLPAQNQSYELGLRLNLKPHEVKSIHATFSDPRKRLLQIVLEFLNQVEPRPTWRVIVDALKSPAVNLPQLAMAVEAAHFPDTTPALVPEASVSSSQSPATSSQPGLSSPVHGSGASPLTEVDCQPDLPQPTTGDTVTELQHRPESPQPSPMTTQYVQAKIRRFEKRFNDLKKAARGCLEKRKISVKQVVDALTSMPADDIEEHELFLKDNLSDLYQSFDISELIGKLSLLQWNYLSYQLLDYLIKEFGLEVRREMEAYKLDLQRFRQKTPLALFCQSQKRRQKKPPEGFEEMVAEFDWPHEVTLEVVEQFRQEYAYHYKLRDCAMLLAKVLPGSFIITWFIPESIVKKLREDIPHLILKKYTVVSLQIAGVKVYPPPQKSAAVSSPGPGPSAGGAAGSVEISPPQPKTEESRLSPEEDYPFVEKPSEDFFCPVTLGLLLQPHLTSCCGKHLSEESATRIQGVGGPCPLCKSPDWSTVLDKHVRRQVKELHVFCRHKEKGCWWKGELSDFTQHVQSCQFRYLQVSTQGRTELHNAAERGDVEAVERLLSTSVNVNSRTEDEGHTALRLASWKGHVEVVRLLLKAGAAVFIPDKDGLSPLYVASQEGHSDVVDILLEAGADVHQATTKVGSVPLGIAAEKGHTETVQRLLEAGANVNHQDKSGGTALLYAGWEGHSEVVKLLLGAGARDIPDKVDQL
ncbi:Ankyrin repeat domain-containing protein 50 [Geodia barretti]|uniref:Ankyrin repeat domain-containing protein 50 n=2 Tax=Geodia barretti TaxID=519541 RepID=A0AA35WP95_GEOBA|nr:Ankyrin repeat domain-containing protein 50 [Geodia barretti]